MDLLLDTHVLIWWDSADDRLGSAARKALADPANSVFVSAASVWEIAIKRARGKLQFTGSPAATISRNGFAALPITVVHAETAGALEWDHSDPFDRMLVAQSVAEGLVLVHADERLRSFTGVGQLWAR